MKAIWPKAHWEKRRGPREKAIAYCCKLESRIAGPVAYGTIKLPPPPPRFIAAEQLYPWQRDAVEIFLEDPDDRTINWFYETEGNTGKTALLRYLVGTYAHDVLVVGGKVGLGHLHFLFAYLLVRARCVVRLRSSFPCRLAT